MAAFTSEQIAQLLRPINPSRVLQDAQGHAHVSQQDNTAHLIRVFGFGNVDTDTVQLECVFEQEHVDKKTGEIVAGRYDVCYRAKVRLTFRNPAGETVCHHEGSSAGVAQNQPRGDAHDLALKAAESVAGKRAAKNMGDQFGLSLYNKGQVSALVKGTLVHGEPTEGDVQEGVEQQVTLGNDETEEAAEYANAHVPEWTTS